VALITFAMGPFNPYRETFKLQPSGEVPLEFFSLRNYPIKEDFIAGEMGNALNYFGAMFGPYPYPVFRAAFHPFGFGQGFASLLLIPNADTAVKNTFRFLSHETGHQWWGNIVGWRSYRDQWLSEGFAEYSGILYTAKRDKPSAAHELIELARLTLKDPPRLANGTIGTGKVTDIGPLVLGQRLASVQSVNGYQRLIYNKGALVLRMVHMLFSNQSTGDDQPFYAMMKDFVDRHQNGSATTESFVAVANEHFARTPIAQQFGLTDLNWFFTQWVWQTGTPSYRLEYTLENLPDGKTSLKGTVFQDDVPAEWTMPVPVVLKFAGGRTAHAMILAKGPQQPVNLTLPLRPQSVELDPELWVLSGKTATKRQ
jgi:aminopeptidase N